MRIELHCHSTCSDGSFPPEEVATRAADRGAEIFCLTDHDTFAGHPATLKALEGREDPTVKVLRGLELSCKDHGRTVHLLMYGLQDGPGLVALEHRLSELFTERQERLRKICARLDGLGIKLDAQKILDETHGVPGRPSVARALVAAGVCTSIREAFTRFLHDGGPADVAINSLTLEDGIAFGVAAGAKTSIAHPHMFNNWDLVLSMCTRAQQWGLGGLEALYGRYGKAEAEGWLRLCDRLGLVATGGSDFHGDAVPAVRCPTITMADDRAAALCDWLGVG